MTPEQQRAIALAAARRRRAEAEAAQPDTAATGEPVEGEGIDLQDARGLAGALNKGTTLGFGDEIAGLGRTLLDYAAPSSWGEDAQSFGDKYAMYRDDQRASDEEFQRENPKTALAAEVAGGLISPVNRVAPGMGATGSHAARTGLAATRAGIEGGITGLGQGDGSLEDQLASAQTGATWGGLAGGLLSGVGGAVGNTFSKQRIARELGKGDDFIPAHLADTEGNVGSFYRKYVGNAIGGRGPLGRQESDYLRNNSKIAGLVDGGETMFPRTVGTRTAVGNLKDKIGKQAKVAGDTVTRQSKKVKSEIPQQKAAIAAQREAQREAIDQATSRQLFAEAMPERMPQELKDTILQSDYDTGEQILSKWWAKDGFQTVKGRTFEWDDGLGRELKSLSENDPAFALTLGNAAAKVDGLVDKLLAQGKKGSDIVPQDFIDELASANLAGINGDALMALRNSFAIPANSGGPSLKGKGLGEIVDKFDDMIKRQLGEDSPEWLQYADEIARWGRKQGVSKAASRARKAGQADIKPKQVGSALKDNKKNAPAFALVRQAEEAKKAIPKKVTDADVGPLIKARSALDNKNRRIDQQATAAKKRVDREVEGMLADDPSSWSQVASTAILGAPFGLGIGALPTGVAVASGLSTPSAQRLIAGQTSAQKKIAEALRSGATSKVTRNAARLAALQATDKEEELY